MTLGELDEIQKVGYKKIEWLLQLRLRRRNVVSQLFDDY